MSGKILTTFSGYMKSTVAITVCLLLLVLSSITLNYALGDSTNEPGALISTISWVVIVVTLGYMFYKFIQCPRDCSTWAVRIKDLMFLGMGLLSFTMAVLAQASPSDVLMYLSGGTVALSSIGLISSVTHLVIQMRHRNF